MPAPLLVGDQQHRHLGEHLRVRRPALARPRATARRRPSCRPCPGPYSRSPSRRSGACEACSMTVSRWPSSSSRPEPWPAIRATMSSALPGVEHGTRSISACGGRNAAHSAIASSAPSTSPEGEDTATSASSSRAARDGDLGGAVSDELIHRHSLPTGRAPAPRRRAASGAPGARERAAPTARTGRR